MRRVAFILFALAGCGEIAGITDLTSEEPPDSGTTPIVDAGPDVAPAEDVFDSTLPAVDATEADKGFRRVFVTSGGHMIYPNMGPAIADTECNRAAADDAGLTANGESWVAWLSSGSVRASSRLPFAGEYRLVNGTPVVKQRSDLETGALLHAIDLNERGLPAEGNNDDKRVWTGTAANGNIANECQGWTASGNLGQFGRAYLASGGWTDNGFTACGIPLRLYCFEK